jgi:iron-sulfur cluster assembly protein
MASLRPRPSVMSITPAAAERVREIVEASERPVAGIRVGIKNGGCAGMSYTVALADAASPGDELVEAEGARVYIDPKAVLFLLGTRMDFRASKLSTGFVFENPNQVSACGCGESVSLKAADPGALADGVPA